MLLCPTLGDLVVVDGIPAGFEQHTLVHILAIVLHAVCLDALSGPLEAAVRASLMSDIFLLHEVPNLVFRFGCHPPPLFDFIGSGEGRSSTNRIIWTVHIPIDCSLTGLEVPPCSPVSAPVDNPSKGVAPPVAEPC